MRKVLNGLMGNFRIDDATGCWNWTKCRTSGGYAQGNYAGKRMAMSRVVAVLYHGLDHTDTKSLALHRCDNRACVNPKHIYIGSHLQNLMDCFSRNRMPKIKKRREFCLKGLHRLTPENVFTKKDGHRVCRLCRNLNAVKWRANH